MALPWRPAALVAALLVSLVAWPSSAASRRSVTVQSDNFRFCAASASFCDPTSGDYRVTVPVGTRVRWTYTDTACDVVVPCPGHNVVFTRGGGNHTLVKSDGAVIFTMVFRRAGTYSYYCGAHKQFGMTGTVVVKPVRR